MADMRYCPCARHGFLLLVLLLFQDELVVAGAQLPPLNTTQEAIMMDVRNLLKAESIDPGWSAAPTPCDWKGISCDNRSGSGSVSVVTGIVLTNHGISNSSIFSHICGLDNLKALDLSRNSVADLFAPSSCPMKQSLQSLNLSSNRLSNSLGDLVGFSHLKVLDLSFNSFHSGNLSRELNNFLRLTSLNLSTNNFKGEVPISMPHSLEDLLLSGNRFSGGIPAGLFEYTNLTTLDLSQNKLAGHVLDNFTKLRKLQTLILSGNTLNGTIPKSLTEVTTLSRFAANQNYLTGSIPSGITRHLKMLDLSYNNLSGIIPSDLLSYPTLETIDLTWNKLVGGIPSNISRSIYRIRLGNNFLNGTIPEFIGNAVSLAYLELNDNQLSGVIPSQILECKALALLNLASNNLQGLVPAGISTLTKLVVLKLENNSLTGTVPNGISFLLKLSILNLSRNALTGEIPQSIVQLANLSNLNLEANSISGTIPTSIGSLGSLIELNLANNSLSGIIPNMPISLSTALNLSHNNLIGSFPPNIDFLEQLEILDLSYNNLSGPVPSSLVNLKSLTQLMLAYNQFSGPVPAFPQHILVNTTGNPGITNTRGIDNNNFRDIVRDKRISAIIGAILGLCLVAIIAISISCCCKIQSHTILIIINGCTRICGIEHVQSSVEESAAQINNGRLTTMNNINTSAAEYMKAKSDIWQITHFQALDFEDVSITQGLIEENLIGHGGSGHVYRVTYNNRYNRSTGVVAVKKILSDGRLDKRLERQFESEVNILGNVRHRNIIKLQCCISNAESKLLVYDYIENGSLDNWLHGHTLCPGHSRVRLWFMRCAPLDWPTRLRAAVGAAQGLCYMHHEYSPPIIHRDVKTSNILLDSEFQAKVADFGLARMLVKVGESDTMSAVAGSFGYMAPEYAYTKKVSEKVDVYSFGVVLLELTSGRKANDGGEHGCLVQWAWHHYRSGESISDATDKCIRYTGYPGEIETVFRLGVQCTSNSPASRPMMKDVLQILLKCSKQTDQKTREERAMEHEAAPLFLPQRGDRWRLFYDGPYV